MASTTRKRKQTEVFSLGHSPTKKGKSAHRKLADRYKKGPKSIRRRLEELIRVKKRAEVKGPDQVFFRTWLKKSSKVRTAGFNEIIAANKLVTKNTKICSQDGNKLNDNALHVIVTFILARGIDEEDDEACQKAQIESGVLPKDEDIIEGVRKHYERTHCNEYTYKDVEKRLQDYNEAIIIATDMDEQMSGEISDRLRTWMAVNNFTDFCDEEDEDDEDDDVSCASTLVINSEEESANDSDDSDDSSIDIADFMDSSTEIDGEISTYDRIKSLSGIRIAVLQNKISKVINECDTIIKHHRRLNERMREEHIKEERKKNVDGDRRFVPQSIGGIQPTQQALELRQTYNIAHTIQERYNSREVKKQTALEEAARKKAEEDAQAAEEAEEAEEYAMGFTVEDNWQGSAFVELEPVSSTTANAWSSLESTAGNNAKFTQMLREQNEQDQVQRAMELATSATANTTA